jgi:O-antigen ligase
VMFQQGLQYQGDDPATSVLALYGAFINNIVIAMFFIMGRIFLTSDWRRYAGIAGVFAIAVTTHFAQFKVVSVVALAALCGAPARMVVIALAAALTLIYAVGIGHVPEMMLTNPNSGIRLAFVADALSSVMDTHGIGIGFGTESVRWRYHFPNMADFTFLPDPTSITPERLLEVLSTGVHNSFVQALLRMGVPGFLLFLAAFFAAFPPRNLPRDVRNHAAIVFAMIFIACFVNPALESPVQVVGIGFVHGYLLALRASARGLAPASAAGPAGPARSPLPSLTRPARAPAGFAT